MEYLLVLTACIDPSTSSHVSVVIADPVVRLAQYEKALKYWLEVKDKRLATILFIENSGYCLDSLTRLAEQSNPHNKQVEFIQLSNNQFPAYLDYGYPELGMLDEAVNVSQLMRQAKYFIKATGRLTFPKLPRLLDLLPRDYHFAVDCRLPIMTRTSPTVSSQLMVFSIQFYMSELVNVKARMNDIFRNMETLLYYKLMDYYGTVGAIMRWPINIDPVGYNAHWGGDYSSGRRKALSAVRAVGRCIVPGLWL